MAARGLTSQVVVAAAADIADREGLRAVSVARVAAAVGVRAPSVYNHVPGHDGLLRGIALEGIRGVTQELREAVMGRSGTEALLAAAAAYRKYAREHPGRYEAAQRAPTSDDEEMAQAGAEAVEAFAAALRAWSLDGDDVVHAVRAVRSTLHGFVDMERLGGFGLDVSVDESFSRLVTGLAVSLHSLAET